MAELTTQEQTDLTTLEGKSFQFKFSQQLNQMSANLNGKISVTQESVDEFKSVKGSTIFKEDLKKAVDTDIWHQHLDDDGNELLDDDEDEDAFNLGKNLEEYGVWYGIGFAALLTLFVMKPKRG